MEDKKCLVELDEVLMYLNEEDLNKIPKDLRDAIKEKKDKEYVWKYDESKKLDEQNLDRKTIAMLSYLNMEYLLNEEQKEFMKKLHEKNQIKQELEKREKYNPDDIFKKEETNQSKSVFTLVEYKKDKWYKKVFLKLIKFFKR